MVSWVKVGSTLAKVCIAPERKREHWVKAVININDAFFHWFKSFASSYITFKLYPDSTVAPRSLRRCLACWPDNSQIVIIRILRDDPLGYSARKLSPLVNSLTQ